MLKNNLGLYIHIPFCKEKCSYCAFISFRSGEDTINNYFNALLKEIKLTSENYKQSVVDTIYIGGGTPSYVKSGYIVTLLNEIKTHFNVLESAEITIECNPESTNKEKLQEYKNAGINRLSVGLQTTNEKLLKLLNRPHNYKDFENVVLLAKEVGLNNISGDLIISLPTEKMSHLKTDIKRLKKLNLKHLSVYDLILEEDTPFYKKIQSGELKQVSEKLSLKMQDYVVKTLKKLGYSRYEVSAYCLKGYESKHNLKYWNLDDYLGLGIAAHSKIGDIRFANTSNLKNYIRNIDNNELNYENIVNLTLEDKKEEFIMLSLRKSEGINLENYKNLFLDDLLIKKQEIITKLLNEKLIKVENNFLFLTNEGFNVLNLIIEKLV